ncbi:MAG TPA: cytochrome c3 family protein [Polyangia bacterium]|nr:cytochrome c3 family protein [Polyangia bacterium]
MTRRRWVWAAFVLAAAGFVGRAAVRRHRIDVELATPRDLHRVAYVGSAACRDCHLDRLASWKRTFHRTMTAEATPELVQGDFGGATLVSAGVTARMDRAAGGRFQMTFSRPGEPDRLATVDRTVGSHRYQQYLTKIADTYWRLPVAWSVTDRRWFPMTSAFLFRDPDPASGGGAAADDGRPLFGGGDFDRHVTRWNDNCVFCHNVAPNPARDPETGRFATTVAELGVACEACHGPGAEHVARNANPARRARLAATRAADPTIVNPSRLSPGRSADVCGRCHGQRLADDVGPFLAHGDPFVPGDDLAIESAPLWRDTPLRGDRGAFAARFWSDGTARLTAYEYQGLLQSPCAMRGPLTCTTCHGMHEGDPRGQIRARFAGQPDAMCTGCHAELAAAPALAAHAPHDPARAGARCVSCHMPRIVYGVLDVHRSHRIEVPDPGRAAAAGRPDACTGCHVDRTAAWAQAAARGFWGIGRYPDGGRVPAGTAPAEAIRAAGPVGRLIAADAIAAAPPPADAPTRNRRLGLLLDVMETDAYPAVREIAWRGLRRAAAGASTAELLRRSAYDPGGPAPARARSVAVLRQAWGGAAGPVQLPVTALRGGSAERDLEIGE